MKKCFAILLTAIYLLSATELKQLLKVPVMIQHFHEHRQEDPNISVWGFIVLHYFSGNIKDADYERDQQLPFKQISLQQVQMDVPPLHYPIAHRIPMLSVGFEVKNAFNSTFLMASSAFLSAVWRPPMA